MRRPLTVTGIGSNTASISCALTMNLIYNVTVVATDGNGISSSATASFDTAAPTLVIEASDFNYTSGQFFDTPPNGGLALYTNQIGDPGIDENKGARTAAKSYYRPNDAVIIQAADSVSFTEQKFVTAAAAGDTTDVELEVGYNSVGDWLNYTRTYGPGGSAPTGTYNVWCYLATSGTGTQADLYQVTSDPTQGNQTSNFLGSFGTSAYSNNNYFNYEYLPLVDPFGNRVAVLLSNTPTLKSVVVGNPNVAFYMLTPAATPSLLSVYPNGPFDATNQFTFTLALNSGASIPSNDISLTLNGVNVTGGLSLTQSGSNWIVSYPIQLNGVYTAVINATNSADVVFNYTVSFDTFSTNYYQLECVDYDFSTNNGSAWVSGLFIDDPVPTGDNINISASAQFSGETATNSYFYYPADFTSFSAVFSESCG